MFVFQPARDQLDNLVAVALKALFFETVLSCPDRVRGDLTVPLAMYIADEFQRYVTSDTVHGEQSFFDICRSHRAARRRRARHAVDQHREQGGFPDH